MAPAGPTFAEEARGRDFFLPVTREAVPLPLAPVEEQVRFVAAIGPPTDAPPAPAPWNRPLRRRPGTRTDPPVQRCNRARESPSRML